MSATNERLAVVLGELRATFAAMAADAVPALARDIAAARRIAVYGVGRNGLALQALAMRLAHLGLDAQFVGQLTAGPVGPGDLFLVAAATGRLPSADALAATAQAAGTRVVVITARPERVAGADRVVHLPAQTMADAPASQLPLGSPFELALWLLGDLVVVELMALLGRSNDALAARHANLL